MARLIKSANYNIQPWWFKNINYVWKNSYALGTRVELEKDKLIKAARKNTGLYDFGKDFWDEPLERLLQSMNEESRLHPLGRFITQKRMENLLSVRLRAENWFKNHPEILEQKLHPVKVIVGLQRTGTTKLHRMLASDKNNRALLSWEALNPAPINGDNNSNAKRILAGKMSEKALKVLSPGFFAIHPVEHLAPEEDVLLLDVSFLSTTPEATMHVPSYSDWLENTDQSLSYEYAAKLLKLLQWQKPAERWILKTPHHLEFPNLVEKHFNDVQFIWTHRNVQEAIPSFLSMVAHSRILFSNEVDSHEVACHWVKKIGYMLTCALDYRLNEKNDKRFMDINYSDLVKDSLSAVKQIYKNYNIPFDSDLQKTFVEAEQLNPQGKYGVHKYSLADFGINQSFIDEATNSYQKFLKNNTERISVLNPIQ